MAMASPDVWAGLISGLSGEQGPLSMSGLFLASF